MYMKAGLEINEKNTIISLKVVSFHLSVAVGVLLPYINNS